MRPAACAICAAPSIAHARPFRAPQIAFEKGDRRPTRISSGSSASTVSSWLAPGQVFIVRCASGVTRIRQRPVGGPSAQRRRFEPDAERSHVMREDLAELVVSDLADEAGVEPPSAATPAMLLAAEPPLISRAGPIAA